MPNNRLPLQGDRDAARYACIDLATILKLRNAGLFIASNTTDAAAMLEALGYAIVAPLAVDAWRTGLCGCPLCGKGQVAQ